MQSMNLSGELDQFLAATHRRKASSIAIYRHTLAHFVQYTESKQLNDRLTVAVADYITTQTNLAPATRNMRLSAITTFLYERQLITNEQRDSLRRIHAPVEAPQYAERSLTPDQLERLMHYLAYDNAKPNTLRRYRDLAIFGLQYACALRIHEIVTLELTDITTDDGYYYIRIRPEHSKNGVERTVPLNHQFTIAGIRIADELSAWLNRRIVICNEPNPSLNLNLSLNLVFLNLRRPNFGTAIKETQLINKFNNLKARCSIDLVNSTHALRHTRITELANDPTIPLSYTAAFAGHCAGREHRPNTTTTINYIRRPTQKELARYV